ncbi:hypothetical protein C0Q70_17182 [Pomacea canaliculata]|uniref:Hexosyltransferase n=1 Tax=Pomacea canaliculata TaxID=400727 RepID=A0A2T7NRV7_POMCA|nr:lactosylceramide 1,3-N-acetyl-beta-D-glucosaminyltransferase-like [Pomacea canaliculata]XP_025110601.1 lactosylceramide 1,3-N-acetyl-beta-D-glucosaminyltransferase-like [Pomacea canaliculata]PVD23907.1 hypothetical protein C0Q70_17182 [Pomacea canaliculata]
MVQGRALLQIASDQFQCSRVVVLGGSGKERYTTFIIAGIFLVCIVQLSAAAGSPKTTAKIIPLKEEPEMEWDDCKFHIDSLQSWQDEQLCQNRSSIDSRPDTCDNCFDPTVLLAINTPTLCDKEQKPGIIDVLFIISSLHQHFRLRTRIRNNWGSVTANNTTNFRHVFLLGTSPNADVMSKVRQEARLFGDMLVGHFNDHYYNLTFKTMMGVNWAVKNCGHARFFVKMDDDVWVNTNRLLVKLQENTLYLQEAIGGMCFVKALVKRDKTSKWYVPEAYYANEFYSQYCYGFAYVGAMAVLEQVLAISRHVPFFFVDDVYVGMCLEQVGFGVIKFPGFKASGDTCKDRNIDDIAVHGALHWRWFPTAATNRPLIARPLHTMLLKMSLFINSSLCIDQGRINPFLNINRDPVKIKLGSLTSLNHLSLSHLLYQTLRTLRPLLDPNLPLNRRPLLNPNVPLILSPPFSTKPPLNRNPPLALSHLLNPNLLFKLLPLLNRSPPLN